jgi:polyisoprenoid-binding protein YceI
VHKNVHIQYLKREGDIKMTMKYKAGITIALAVSVLIPSASYAQLSVDNPGKTVMTFSGDFVFLSEAPVEKIKGTSQGATGVITTNTEDLTQTSGSISVPVASMKTGNSKRDKHLQSKHWLDAKKFPVITFDIKSVRVVKLDDSAEIKVGQLEATGSFSLHGVIKTMTIPLTLKWKGASAKVTAEFEVQLADFAVEGKKGVVGDRVGKTIQLTANLKGQVQ